MAVEEEVKGSYDFGRLSFKREELVRLKKQALAGWDLEAAWLREAGLEAGMRVLDVGCGPGFLSEKIAQEFGGCEVVGLELDDDLFAVATQVARNNPRLSVLKGNIYDTPLDPGGFDFACARLVFQHLDDPAAALHRIKDSLRPGGIVLIVDVDDSLLALYPPPPRFEEIVEWSRDRQSAAGGDRLVGRKLPHLLGRAGFSGPRFKVVVVTSLDLGLDNFLDVAVSSRVRRAAEEGLIDEAAPVMSGFRRQCAESDSYGFVGVVVCWAVKGGS